MDIRTEWTFDSFQEWIASAQAIARELLLRDGHLKQVALIALPTGREYGVSLQRIGEMLGTILRESVDGRLTSDIDSVIKERIVRALRDFLKCSHAVGVICIQEAWIRLLSIEQSQKVVIGGDDPSRVVREKDIPPSEHPDRKEAITINWEYRDGDRIRVGLWYQTFERINGENNTGLLFAEPVAHEAHDRSDASGRLVGFLE